MSPQDALIASALITAVLALAGVIYTQRTAKHSTDQSTGAKLVEEALDQMRETIREQGETIERQGATIKEHGEEISQLKVQLAARDRVIRAAAIFIDRIGLYLAGGMQGVKPRPGEILHEHIDLSLWDNPPPQLQER